MPRRICPEHANAWDEAGPGIRRVVARKAGAPELEHIQGADLTAEQMLIIASTAGILSWLFSELECIAPLSDRGADADERHERKPGRPFPEITLQ